jgi:hypothetical protein
MLPVRIGQLANVEFGVALFALVKSDASCKSVAR